MFNSKKKQQQQQLQEQQQRAAAAEAAALRDQLQVLAGQNAALERRIAELDERVDQRIAERIDERIDAYDKRASESRASEQLSLVSPFPPPPLVSAAGTDLNERIETLRDQLAELSDRTAGIDARVTSVSTELTNQLVELSSDIDALNRTDERSGTSDDGGSAVDTEALEARIAERLDVAIDDVLDATERLAAEQARYQITFRADLAELADRLRRPGAV